MDAQGARRHRTAEAPAARGRRASLPKGFLTDIHSTEGTLRWYLVHTPDGMERSTAEKIRKIISSELLEDAFVVSKERWVKRSGTWSKQVRRMYPEYFLVATRNVAALDKALAKLSFHVRVAGSEERAYQPMAREVQAWLEASMDESHVLRSSTAEIVNGELRIFAGPLVGQEPRIVRFDRRKRFCLVDVGHANGGFIEALPLDIPFKS